jgi:hypothetical protein
MNMADFSGLTGFLAAGGIFGIVTACWAKIKTIVWRIVNLFIQTVTIYNQSAHFCVMSYVVGHYKKSSLYDKVYDMTKDYTRDGKFGYISYEVFGVQSMIFWNGWFPFLVTLKSNANDNGSTGEASTSSGKAKGSNGSGYPVISFFRWTLNTEKLLVEATKERNAKIWNELQDVGKNARRFRIKYIPSDNGDTPWARLSVSSLSRDSSLPWYKDDSVRLLSHHIDELGNPFNETQSALNHLIFPK